MLGKSLRCLYVATWALVAATGMGLVIAVSQFAIYERTPVRTYIDYSCKYR